MSVPLIVSQNEEKPTYATTFRSVWDDHNLYVGFECQDPDAASTVHTSDGPVSSEEYVAVYFSPSADTLTYYMMEVAPTGVVHDAFVLRRSEIGTTKILSCWNCEGMRVSVTVYGGGAQPNTPDRFWTVEMALPFKEFTTAPLIPPHHGDSWRFNVYRVELTNCRDYLAFFPTGSEQFNTPTKFVALKFTE